jgi:hypothetical protein
MDEAAKVNKKKVQTCVRNISCTKILMLVGASRG